MNGGTAIGSRDYWSPYDELYGLPEYEDEEEEYDARYDEYMDFCYESARDEDIFKKLRETDGKFY